MVASELFQYPRVQRRLPAYVLAPVQGEWDFGRDELEIPVKAKLDGEYVERMSFFFDIKCFVGTVVSVLKSDGVVEGGTGELNKEKEVASK